MFDIEDLRTFSLLIESLNFSDVAKKLYVSQATVTRRIRSLEKALGVQLFDRDTRNVTPTKTAMAILDDVNNTLVQVDKIFETVCSMKEVASVIKLTCPEYWLERYIEPLVFFIREQDPTLIIDIVSNPPVFGVSCVEEEVCDVAFGINALNNDNMPISPYPFIEERFVALMHVGNPLSAQNEVCLDDLLSLPLVLLDDGSGGYKRLNEMLLQKFADKQLGLPELHYAVQAETIGIAIEACKGYGLIPESLARIHRNYLKAIPFTNDELILPLCFFYKSNALEEKLVRFFALVKKYQECYLKV